MNELYMRVIDLKNFIHLIDNLMNANDRRHIACRVCTVTLEDTT